MSSLTYENEDSETQRILKESLIRYQKEPGRAELYPLSREDVC